MQERIRSSSSFAISACLHGMVVGWLAAHSGVHLPLREGSVYDQEIRPYEKHLVWYNLKDKLPDVSPPRAAATPRKLRAKVKFNQELVAGTKDLPSPPQLIRMPAPKIDLPKALDLPNVLAVAPIPRPSKAFQPPPPTSKATTETKPLSVPQAPELQLALDLAPKTLPFEVTLPKPRARAFTPPPAAVKTAAPAEAPPSAPEITAPAPAPATLVIVGLNPVKAPDPPPPPGSHDAAFSAGPEPRHTGASEVPAENATVTVPGLVARGGTKNAPSSVLSVLAPLSMQHIAAEAAAAPHLPTPPPKAPESRAAHVSSSPDPRMRGRYIYTVAIQMPNVTSYSGSWIVWFADRDPATGAIPADMRPPDPTRKVDPKYIQTAAEERVEGIVRLSAVIRRDGRVESVELLQHLDERLDRSAEEALAKWIFQPALRDGVPVDVDAVFEIPFRLAPRLSR